MKRSLSLLCLFLVLCLTLCACTNNAPGATNPETDTIPNVTELDHTEPLPSESANYADAELARAVSLGFGEYKDGDPPTTYAEFFKMLDRTVELADTEKLEQWRSIPELSSARNSTDKMTRSDGMFAVLCAAESLGEEYASVNTVADWAVFEEKTGNRDTQGYYEAINRDVFPEKLLQETPSVLFNPQDDYEERIGDAFTYCSQQRQSEISEKTIFSPDESAKTMRCADSFLHTEALLAALRLYDSGHKVTERWPSSEDIEFLKKANERKQAILNSPTTVTVTGTKYYVSNSGNDKNNGKSPENAWATINKALTVKKSGDGVFFERGGVFRGTLITNAGITYSAYGEGPKPVITTSPENGTGAEKWALVLGTKNIWVFYNDMVQCGSLVVNGDTVIQRTCAYWDGDNYLEVLDFTVRENNMTIGDAFDIHTMLPNQTFFNDIRYPQGTNLADLPMDTEGKLYFRCDEGNPGEVYESIEFSANGSHPTTICVGIVNKNVVIDNIAFLYAANGVNCEYGPRVANSIIQNCEVGYTGGRVIAYDNSKFSGSSEQSREVGRDGDGIMLMGNNVTARNNYIHDTWDHAFTIETMYGTWSDKEKQAAKSSDFKYYYDIIIEDNLAENCASLFLLVDWTLISTSYERPERLNEYRDITVRNNYSLYNGYHWRTHANGGQELTARGGMGFGYPVGSGGIVVESNTIYRTNIDTEFACISLFFYPEAEFPIFNGNVLIQDNYAPLVYRAFGTTDLDDAKIICNNDFPDNKSVEQRVRELLGDDTAEVLPMSFPPSTLP